MRPIFWLIAALAFASCDRKSISWACGHDPDFDCSGFAAARARLARPATQEEDPYDAVEGDCGPLRFLQYRVDQVPTDQQEDLLITQFYGAGDVLVAARVANNLDGSGTFSKHVDYGVVACTPKTTGVVNPAKTPFRRR